MHLPITRQSKDIQVQSELLSKNSYNYLAKESKTVLSTVADPELELIGGNGFDLVTLLAFFPSVISSFFIQNKGRGLDLPL